MTSPEISVVMSVYNGARYLRSSIDSILNQDGVDFEFIIVNDGSTDESPGVLNEYAVRDSRIRLYHQENQGLTKALVRGCGEARGRYIARQDNGDLSLPDRLKLQRDILANQPEVVFTVGWVRQVLNDGTEVGNIQLSSDVSKLTRCLRENMVGVPAHGCVMFRRDIYLRIGGYRKEFYYAQDCDIWLRFAEQGAISCVQEYVYDLNISVGGISTHRQKLQQAFCRVAQHAYQERMKGKSDAKWMEQAKFLCQKALQARGKKPSSYEVAGSHFRLGALLEKSNKRAAQNEYRLALEICPYYWRAWFRLIA